MNTTIQARPAFNGPAGTSLFEIFLCICLITLMIGGTWALFASMPAYGGQQPTSPAVTFQVAALAPVCFDHTREQVQAQGAPQGCPTDPMAYHPATFRNAQD